MYTPSAQFSSPWPSNLPSNFPSCHAIHVNLRSSRHPAVCTLLKGLTMGGWIKLSVLLPNSFVGRRELAAGPSVSSDIEGDVMSLEWHGATFPDNSVGPTPCCPALFGAALACLDGLLAGLDA